MYTVTAIYQDSEIGYGEGESYEYAMQECIESIDSIHREFAADDITLRSLNPDSAFGLLEIRTPLSLWMSIVA